MNWEILRERFRAASFGFEQFNDILLLVNQRPVSPGFFSFFFRPERGRITHDQFRKGITRFTGFSILCFGNLRFSFRKLRTLTEGEIQVALWPYSVDPKELRRQFRSRPRPRPLPAAMLASKTWLLGYIARKTVDQDLATYYAALYVMGLCNESEVVQMLEPDQIRLFNEAKLVLSYRSDWKSYLTNLDVYKKRIRRLQRAMVQARHDGWLNTTHYLAADFMDVYVATSMREKWEFEDVSKAVRQVFSSSALKHLRLRHFDPTQSHLDYRIDKGLVEALMLKRAVCTVYLAQETDTLGKDSELASTLAQGKPVIAYVPKLNRKKQMRLATRRTLGYLQKRLSQLAAEGRVPQEDLPFVHDFLGATTKFRPILKLAREEEGRFLEKARLATDRRRAISILAEAEVQLYESRAATLQRTHPLAVQVQLGSGVANGVLVVRSPRRCAQLIERLMTNSCEFEIEANSREGAVLLIERISKCPFRVLTQNPTITNSFWSYYLTETRHRTRLSQGGRKDD